MTSGSGVRGRHIVVVEAFDGQLEYLTDEVEERTAAALLGLPWDVLAALTAARITVLDWSEWYAWETRPGSPFTWETSRPITRPSPARPCRPVAVDRSDRIVRRGVPARDPEHGEALSARGPGPLSHGLLANGDPWLWLSWCLRDALIRLSAEDPFDVVVVPQWGGLGYLAQLARVASLDRALDVPWLVVVTDPSVDRRVADQEGEWTRETTARRQMEDVSIALADGAIAFGPRGVARAAAWRLPDAAPATVAPRRVDEATVAALRSAAERRVEGTVQPFLHEPQRGSAGVLAALDAVSGLDRAAGVPRFVSAGPDCVFAPMQPRTFREYWSSRGFVRDLMAREAWAWQDARPVVAGLGLRVFASAFEYLPGVHLELARASAVLVSAAAAEGLAPEPALPQELLLEEPIDAERLAAALRRVCGAGESVVDDWRRALTTAVADACEAPASRVRLEETAALLERAAARDLPVPDVGRCFAMMPDRTRALNHLARAPVGASGRARSRATSATDTGGGRLTTVVTSYEMGGLVAEAVRSVWAGERGVDDVVLIDDGSRDEDTRQVLAALEAEASARALPLRVIRQENAGLSAARNRGLAETATEFVCFLDGDDLLEPAFHRLAVPLLERVPALGGVAAWARIFGDGVPEGGWFWNAAQPELPALLVENSVIVPCVMRTAQLREVGGYAAELRYNYEDWELAVRLLATGWPILTIPAYLMRYRVRRQSMYRGMTDAQHRIMRERMLAKHRLLGTRFGVELALLLDDRRLREAAHAVDSSAGLKRSLASVARSGSIAIRALLQRMGAR